MQDLLKVAIPAALALAGVLAAAILTHRRWKQELKKSKEDAYTTARREAYQALWARLEEVNLALRDDLRSNPSLFASLKDVNTLFLQNSLYLDDDDQVLINRYVEALHRWRSAIYASGDEDVASAFSRTWMSIPPEVDAEIGESNRQVTQLRAALLDRFRKNLTH